MSGLKFKDYYDLLGLPRDGSLTVQKIKSAFMAKALIWHPDKAPTAEDVPVYTKIYEELQQAYKILSNEDSRRQYTDSQQSTNLDLTKHDRDLSYQRSDEYGTVTSQGYQFNRDKFVNDFEKTRDKEDRKMIESLAEKSKAPVSTTEFEQYMKAREQNIEIPKIFNTEGGTSFNAFNASVFHQAFEYVKAKQPARGLEEYVGDPVASGLAELDEGFSGINFGNGLSFSGDGFQGGGVDIGVAFNPTALDMNMFSTEARLQEGKMSSLDMERRMQQIQQDRALLAQMKQEEFSREPTEIERLYSGLFQDMTEGLMPKKI
jgi:curved DNA-binding protein CbpA